MKDHSTHRKALVRSFLGVILFIATPALLAQEQAETEESKMETITVYGEKIARSLQDTQASVAVVTGSEIAKKDIQNFRDAFRLMGNVIDADWADAGFVIRGVNSEGLTPGGSPLAGIYVDGAAQTVQGARRGARGLWDVEQVEVYRGPQSTLSERASLAGAIYIRTRDPQYDWDVSARATVANLDTLEGAVAFGGPITPGRSAFRISAEYQSSENDLNYPGYESYSRFDDFIENEFYQVRGKLLFEPEILKDGRIVFSIAVSHDSPIYDDIAGPGLGFEYSERRGDLNASLPFFQETRSADNTTSSLEITYPISGALDFTSLTTFSGTDMERPSINEGTPGEIFVTAGGADQDLFTQEFRLNSGRASDKQWVLGLYYASEDSNEMTERSTFFGGGRADVSVSKFETTNIALFGEISLDFADSWTAILGGRYDYQSQDTSLNFMRDNFNPATPDIVTSGSAEDSLSEFLPKAGLVFDFSEDRSLGLVIQKGFRPGGVGIDSVDGSPFSFDAEYTWTTEMSYRSIIANGNVVLNANLFHTDWDDQQVEVQLVPGDFTSSVTLNAGKSSLNGGELEIQFAIGQRVDAFASIGYVDTNFDEFVTQVGDFSGLPFPEAPETTIAVGFDYEGDSGFFFGVDAKVVDDYLARDLQNTPVDKVGDYTVANVRIGYRANRWSVTVFSDNAFDEEYFVYRDVIGTFDCCGSLGPRRVTGVTIRYGN